jgi:hypothetical protein
MESLNSPKSVSYHGFYPYLSDVLEGLDPISNTMLCYCNWWTGKMKKHGGWFWQTNDQWFIELGLGRNKALRHRRILKDLGLLEEERRQQNGGMKIFYRVNKIRLRQALINHAHKNQDSPHYSLIKHHTLKLLTDMALTIPQLADNEQEGEAYDFPEMDSDDWRTEFEDLCGSSTKPASSPKEDGEATCTFENKFARNRASSLYIESYTKEKKQTEEESAADSVDKDLADAMIDSPRPERVRYTSPTSRFESRFRKQHLPASAFAEFRKANGLTSDEELENFYTWLINAGRATSHSHSYNLLKKSLTGDGQLAKALVADYRQAQASGFKPGMSEEELRKAQIAEVVNRIKAKAKMEGNNDG